MEQTIVGRTRHVDRNAQMSEGGASCWAAPVSVAAPVEVWWRQCRAGAASGVSGGLLTPANVRVLFDRVLRAGGDCDTTANQLHRTNVAGW